MKSLIFTHELQNTSGPNNSGRIDVKNKIRQTGVCSHILCSPYLFIYETEKGDADLHAQVVQTKDGRLQQ